MESRFELVGGEQNGQTVQPLTANQNNQNVEPLAHEIKKRKNREAAKKHREGQKQRMKENVRQLESERANNDKLKKIVYKQKKKHAVSSAKLEQMEKYMGLIIGDRKLLQQAIEQQNTTAKQQNTMINILMQRWNNVKQPPLNCDGLTPGGDLFGSHGLNNTSSPRAAMASGSSLLAPEGQRNNVKQPPLNYDGLTPGGDLFGNHGLNNTSSPRAAMASGSSLLAPGGQWNNVKQPPLNYDGLTPGGDLFGNHGLNNTSSPRAAMASGSSLLAPGGQRNNVKQPPLNYDGLTPGGDLFGNHGLNNTSSPRAAMASGSSLLAPGGQWNNVKQPPLNYDGLTPGGDLFGNHGLNNTSSPRAAMASGSSLLAPRGQRNNVKQPPLNYDGLTPGGDLFGNHGLNNTSSPRAAMASGSSLLAPGGQHVRGTTGFYTGETGLPVVHHPTINQSGATMEPPGPVIAQSLPQLHQVGGAYWNNFEQPPLNYDGLTLGGDLFGNHGLNNTSSPRAAMVSGNSLLAHGGQLPSFDIGDQGSTSFREDLTRRLNERIASVKRCKTKIESVLEPISHD